MNINVPIEYWTFRCSLEKTGFHTIHAEFHIRIRFSLSTLSRSIEWTWAIRLPDYFRHIQKSTSFMSINIFVYVINFLKPDQIFTQHLTFIVLVFDLRVNLKLRRLKVILLLLSFFCFSIIFLLMAVQPFNWVCLRWL